jgi:hypothetical protein
MTVIMGATFVGGVVIAADTLLHDPNTMDKVMNSAKTMSIGNRVVIAQAGEFTGTYCVWEELRALDPASVTPEAVVDCIRRHAGAIHAERAKTGKELKTWYLVGGFGDGGIPILFSIAIHQDDVKRHVGDGQIIAIGTLPDATDRATQAVRASLKPMSNVAMLDEWVRRVVADEAAASPKAVGFPATLLVVRPDVMIDAQVEERGVHDSRLEGFFA